MDQLISVRELNDSIEHWMRERYDVNIRFDGRNALQQLEQLGLLKSQKLGQYHDKFVTFFRPNQNQARLKIYFHSNSKNYT